MKNIIYIFLSMVFIPSAWSQNITDIVRWSDFRNTGTAGSLGVSNSIGAVGGDITAAGINPAGIAEFKKFVFNFSAGMNSVNNRSYLTADAASINNAKSNQFGFYNAGLVFGNYRPKKNFTSSNFAIGFTRQNTFKEKVFFSGRSRGSITEYFANTASNFSDEELEYYPAYITEAIFQDPRDLDSFLTDFKFEDIVLKEQNITRSGNLNEWSFTWAGEYKDKFNIGIGIGIPVGTFKEQKVYVEQDPENNILNFNYLNQTENLNVSVRGFNFKVGFVAKPLNWLRIGGSLHSPTWYNLTENYEYSLEYHYNDIENVAGNFGSSEPFEYKIITPWKAVGSLGSVYSFGNVKGFINADIEFIDYSSAEYNGTSSTNTPEEIEYTNSLNQTIANTLTAATNFRLGTEIAYEDFRLRGGWYQFYSPFANQRTANNSYSMGLGFRGESFFIDFALQFNEILQPTYYAYPIVDSEVKTYRQNTLGLVTLGFRL